MKQISIIIFVSLFVLLACREGRQSIGDFITVDVTKKYPKKELILQDLFDIEYIPLETSDEFITMGYIQAIGDEIIIVRNRSMFALDGNIFIFDKKGKSVRKIDHLGQGGEEYTFILGITLDERNNELFVNDHRSGKVQVYDQMGNFKRSFGHKKSRFRSQTSNSMENIYYDQIELLDQDNLILHEGTNNYDGIKRSRFFIISKQDGSVKKEIEIPYKEKKSTLIRVTNASGGLIFDLSARNQELIPDYGNWLLVEPSSDTIYRFLPDHSMTPFIVRTPSIQLMEPEVFLFPGVLTDRYYFMQTTKKEADITTKTGFPRTNLVYDRKEKTIYESVVYNNDYLNNEKTVDLVYQITLINNNKVAFAQKIEAHELVEAYEKGELKGELKEIAATLDEESNPVIMLAKHKK